MFDLYNFLRGEELARKAAELRDIQRAEKMSVPAYKKSPFYTAYPARLVLSKHNIRFIPSGSYSSELLDTIKGGRKEISDFSVKSRANFANKLDNSTFNGRLFITLTYPRTCVPSLKLHSFKGVSKVAKNRPNCFGFSRLALLKNDYGLRTFFPCDLAFAQCKAFMRSVDRFSYQFKHHKKPLWFWKREFQKDGTIHFHLLTDFIPYAHRYTHSKWFYKGKTRKGYINKGRSRSSAVDLLPVDFIQDLQNTWSHIIGERCNGHQNSVDVAPVRSLNGSIHYMAKYFDKKTECTACPKFCINLGRYWGIQNRKFYQSIKPLEITLPSSVAHKVRAFLHYNLDSEGFDWKYLLKTRHYVKETWFKPDNIKLESAFCSYLIDLDIPLRTWNNSVYNHLDL